jgi:TolB-like protein
MLGVIALVCLGFTTSAVSSYRAMSLARSDAVDGLNRKRIAVLYFRDLTPGAPLQYVADGLTEGLISELGSVRALDVVTRNGTAQFRGTDVEPDSVAKALEAGTLVDGTVEKAGDRIRVNVRLLDGGSGVEFGRAGFERPDTDLMTVREELSKEASEILRKYLGDDIRLQELARETTPAAWALYQRAEKARKDAEDAYRKDDDGAMNASFSRADSLLAQAQLVDGSWLEPAILRGYIDFRRARLAAEPQRLLAWVSRGLVPVEGVLGRDPRNAEALAVRGTLRYWKWLQDLVPDSAAAATLLDSAQKDLETAVELDPTQAEAHSALSHLYFRTGQPAAGLVEARRAYEEDAYLDAAPDILWRLTTGNYDLAEFTQSRRWCDEGGKRFPADYRYTQCRIILMTTRATEPRPDEAWRLLARQDSLAPATRRAEAHATGAMYTAGVIARAGMPDSAKRVLSRTYAAVTPEVDPEHDLLRLRAYILTLAGDTDGAIDVLKQYAAVVPHSSFDHYWWWQEVRASRRYGELTAER